MFKGVGFKIEIETNLKIVHFLDVTFNLANSTYRPYRKPNDNLLYIHTSSNHLPQIIKHLPDSTEERLSSNSFNEQVFNSAKTEYEKALKDSGYKNVKLNYKARKEQRKKNNRNKKLIWFNPPYSKQVSMNTAKRFLNLLDLHFPKQHRLYKIFNRNNVKVSYSCTENMSSFISSHNKKLLNSRTGNIKPFNCRKKDECPLSGQCLAQNIVYKCIASTSMNPDKTYLGTTEGDFKKRYNNHTNSFRHKLYSKETALSKYIWEIKKEYNKMPTLKWSVVKSVPSYSGISKKCLSFLHEKLEIINFEDQDHLLNKRSELISKCRHANKCLLRNYKANN